MESLEERNLNRLRKGKMMLEYSELSRSPIYTFVLALFFGYLGAHRFYLGHKLLGLILIGASVGIGSLMFLVPSDLVGYLTIVLTFWILVEIILAPVFTSVANRKVKVSLMKKYNVVEVT